jgi:hypothetical protein
MSEVFCVKRVVRFLGLLLAVFASMGVGCPPTAPRRLVSVAVSGPGGATSATLGVGGTAQLKATASYNDGSTEDVTSSVNWASSSPGTATVSASGQVMGVAPNSSPATISATLQDFNFGQVVISNGFPVTVVAPPTITNINITRAYQGQVYSVTLTGTNFVPGATVNAGAGVSVSEVTVVNSTTITATFGIVTTTTTGFDSVTVTTPAGPSNNNIGFLIEAPPTFTGISPGNGAQGATNLTVVLTGTNFDPGSTVSFSGTGITQVGSPQLSGDQKSLTLVVNIDPNAPQGPQNVTVVTNGVTLDNVQFTVTPSGCSLAPYLGNTYVGTLGGALISGSSAQAVRGLGIISSVDSLGNFNFSGFLSTATATAQSGSQPLSGSIVFTPGSCTGSVNITGLGTFQGFFTPSGDAWEGIQQSANFSLAPFYSGLGSFTNGQISLEFEKQDPTVQGTGLAGPSVFSPSGLQTFVSPTITQTGLLAMLAEINLVTNGSASASLILNSLGFTYPASGALTQGAIANRFLPFTFPWFGTSGVPPGQQSSQFESGFAVRVSSNDSHFVFNMPGSSAGGLLAGEFFPAASSLLSDTYVFTFSGATTGTNASGVFAQVRVPLVFGSAPTTGSGNLLTVDPATNTVTQGTVGFAFTPDLTLSNKYKLEFGAPFAFTFNCFHDTQSRSRCISQGQTGATGAPASSVITGTGVRQGTGPFTSSTVAGSYIARESFDIPVAYLFPGFNLNDFNLAAGAFSDTGSVSGTAAFNNAGLFTSGQVSGNFTIDPITGLTSMGLSGSVLPGGSVNLTGFYTPMGFTLFNPASPNNAQFRFTLKR